MLLRYTNDVPEELKNFIASRIEPMLPFLPDWCTSVVVGYAQSKDDVLSCEVQYEYRRVIIYIHPLFLEDEDWSHSLLHEIGHSLVKPVIQFGDQLIEHFVDDEEMQKFLLEQFAYAEEQVAEDIAEFAKKIAKAGRTLSERSEADETRGGSAQAKAGRGKRRRT